ncbi:MAG: pyruvate kinase [Christensenellaceae bacterium]
MRKTKIIATIGPASREIDTLKEMVREGMNVARLNFSHGDHNYHKETIKRLKQVRQEMGVPLAIMLDTKGPEIRTRLLADHKTVALKRGNQFILTNRDIEGSETEVSITYKNLPSEVPVGTRILIDDGLIELKVIDLNQTDIVCKIIRGGTLGEKKGINIPSIKLNMPYLSQTDKDDLLFGIENDVDIIAASFVRSKADVIELRKYINYYSGHDIKLISKIENTEGIQNFDDILKNSDGIMIARGDMGVEVDFTLLPGLQKQFIRKCYQSGKTVITATQMLESMIKNPTPTRAEISDVANAVFDGTSAIMLSGETANGLYPIEAIKVMSSIAVQAEADRTEACVYSSNYDIDETDITNAVCDAACTTARDIKAKAIIALTLSGNSARNVSKFRPIQPIVAATPSEKTYHQLSLSWGVYPVLARHKTTFDDLTVHAIDCAKMFDYVVKGDSVVIVAGMPLDTPGMTNTIRVAPVK